MSFSHAALIRKRNTPSIVIIMKGNTRKFKILILIPRNKICTPRKRVKEPKKSTPPSNFELYKILINLASQLKLFSKVYRSCLILQRALLIIPTPIYVSIQILKSNMFQSISLSTNMIIDKWQKGEYSRAAILGSERIIFILKCLDSIILVRICTRIITARIRNNHSYVIAGRDPVLHNLLHRPLHTEVFREEAPTF